MILFALSIIFSNKGKTKQKSKETAILNPKYKNEAAFLEIQIFEKNISEKIILEKTGDFWILNKSFESDKIVTFADSKLINSFLEKLSDIREVYKVSDKSSAYKSLGVDSEGAVSVNISGFSGESYCNINFGKTNSLKNRIYFKTKTSNTAYETDDNLSQYLTIDENYWSDGSVLPEIQNIAKISFSENQSFISINESNAEFSDIAKSIKSLNHGLIKTQFHNTGSILSTLTFYDENGRISKIDFYEYKKESADDAFYYYKKSVTPSFSDSSETSDALLNQNADFEISLWTYKHFVEKISSFIDR